MAARVASARGAGGVDRTLINARLPATAATADRALSTIGARITILWNSIFGRDTRKSCSMAPSAHAIFVTNNRLRGSLQPFLAG
jgi:hypothetical protein